MPRGNGLDSLAVEGRMFLVKQRIEHVLTLLSKTDAPASRATFLRRRYESFDQRRKCSISSSQ